ncbi:MAG: GNAT family N-acetyltransferase [Deltaproteobacteria bacterium]|nr:MAG: GNAT family N-acetyltransferase [Deltaproteobacteria bacterium]
MEGLTLGDGVRLRAATEADDAAMAAMIVALYVEDPSDRPIGEEQALRTLRHLRTHPEAGRALLVEGDGPLGYALVVGYWSNELGGRIAVLDELYVAPVARGRGLGGALIAALAERRVPGFTGIVAVDLEVTPDNARAWALYQRLGFVPQKNRGLRRALGPG